MRRRTVIIAAIVVTLLGLISVAMLFNRGTDPESTGGSGVVEYGHLVLRGYETKSNSNAKVSLGTYLTTKQQRNIRSFLEVLLFKIKNNEEYMGNVIPGSVDVDYQKNIVQFKVQIEDPDKVYTVRYNTVNDDLSIIDEAGETFTPTGQ